MTEIYARQRTDYRTPRQPRTPPQPVKRHRLRLLFVATIAFIGITVFGSISGHATTGAAAIKSGITGYCLDDHKDLTTQDNTVEAWGCNGSTAQNWTVSRDTITHLGSYCLSVKNGANTQNSPVVLNSCSGTPGQIWLRDKSGYQNPNSGLCLAAPNNASDTPLVLASCDGISQSGEQWNPSSGSLLHANCPDLKTGEKIACYAEQEWTAWQASSSNHENLLAGYTDGNAYEEWCADFVSYIYKEAGYPFTQGERDNWDEYDANSVQNMGFTMHNVSSGYVPQPGDVAYFNYDGGHVEIVVAGGKTPTFVYGDSGTIDPATGNGDMKANTITNDGDVGGVVYYLSPNNLN